MSRVLRPVRTRKKRRKRGPVDVIRREDSGDLALDAQVELIRSLVPLGLMHVDEMLDDDVTALAGARYARQDAAIGGRRHGSHPGTVGLAGPRVPMRVPRMRRVAGGRDSAAVLRRVAWRGRGQRPAADAGALGDFVPPLRGRGGGDARGDRAVGVDRVPDVHPGQGRETARVPRASPLH